MQVINDRLITDTELFVTQVLNSVAPNDPNPNEPTLLRRSIMIPPFLSAEIDALAQNTGWSRNRVIIGLIEVGIETVKDRLSDNNVNQFFTLKTHEAFKASQSNE